MSVKKMNVEIQDYTNRIKRSPNDPKLYYNRGMIFVRAKQYDQAISDFSDAISMKSDFFEALYNRGYVYNAFKKNYTAAVRDFDSALEIKRSSTVYYDRALAFHRQGNIKSALQDYTLSIEIGGGNVSTFNNRGICQETLKKYEAAKSDFHQALKLNPKNVDLQKNLERIKVRIQSSQVQSKKKSPEKSRTHSPSAKSPRPTTVLLQKGRSSRVRSSSLNLSMDLREELRKMKRNLEEETRIRRNLESTISEKDKRLDYLEKQNTELSKRYSRLERSYQFLKNDVEKNKKILFEIPDHEIKIQDELGRGSYGSVFSAEWKRETNIAVKEFNITPQRRNVRSSNCVSSISAHSNSSSSHLSTSPTNEAIREFQGQVSLIHENILRVFGFSIHSPTKFRIIMERLDMNLLEYIWKERRTLREKIDLMKRVVCGIDYLHTRHPSVVHRDIKSVNVLMSSDGKRLKLTDFGLSKTIQHCHSVFCSTEGSHAKGTSYYMSPEIIKNQVYSTQSDIYSLGVLFHEVLYEKIPYEGVNPQIVMYKVVHDNKRPDFCSFFQKRNVLKKKNDDDEEEVKQTEIHPLEKLKELIEMMWDRERKKRPSSSYILSWFEENEESIKNSVDFFP